MHFINNLTKKSLNIDTIDEELTPCSPLGKKYIENTNFFKSNDSERLTKEYIDLDRFIKSAKEEIISNLKIYLFHCKNIKLILEKSLEGYNLELYEIQEVKNFTYYSEKLRNELLNNDLNHLFSIICLEDLFTFLDIDRRETPSFYISSEYSSKLYEIRNKIADLSRQKKFLKERALQNAKKSLNISSFENKIVASKVNKELISKLKNSDFFYIETENFANITFHFHFGEDFYKLEKTINKLIIKAKQIEVEIRAEISSKIKEFAEDLLNIQIKLGKLDWFIVRYEFHKRNNCIIPEIIRNDKIEIVEAVNIPLKKALNKENISYQAVDLKFNDQMNLITGANMAGKTTILKTIAQFQYLAARGVPLPAKECKICLFDFIFFSGATRNSNRMDLSSFGSEVVEINTALQRSGKGLFIIDEFARGTNPKEGAAFSKAIFSSLKENNFFTIATTHFSLGNLKFGKNYRINGIRNDSKNKIAADLSLKEKINKLHEIIDYSLIEIKDEKSVPEAALFIAEALGIAPSIIEKAKNNL